MYTHTHTHTPSPTTGADGRLLTTLVDTSSQFFVYTIAYVYCISVSSDVILYLAHNLQLCLTCIT